MTTASVSRSAAGIALLQPSSGTLAIALTGDWLLESKRPSADEALARIEATEGVRRVEYDTSGLGDWDTGLVHLLTRLEQALRRSGVAVAHDGLPEGAARLVELAFAVEPRGDRRPSPRHGLLHRVGEGFTAAFDNAGEGLGFLGQLTLSFGRLLRGRATYQRNDLWVTLQEVSAEALGIVSLISFLVGIILALIGAGEFQKLGAGIYTANLVGLGMVRVLSPIMTGIIMAGRTGAAFAAQIGTMKVNEEIDALLTLGIDPIDYLVLPRALALALMMPLLALYSILLGIAGGTLVAVAFLGITPELFVGRLVEAVALHDLVGGLVMAAVFGVLVAISGCQRGIECGSSAQAVGDATTSAVVTGIVSIVAACAILSMIYMVLGI